MALTTFVIIVPRVVFVLLKLTSSSNLVARRLEKEVKQVLDEISYDQTAKERLIRGRQVDLAEELSKWILVCRSKLLLTFYTFTSVCIFSSLFSVYFLWYYKENLSNNQTPLKLAIISFYSHNNCHKKNCFNCQILFLDEIYPDEKNFWLEFKPFVFKTTKRVRNFTIHCKMLSKSHNFK